MTSTLLCSLLLLLACRLALTFSHSARSSDRVSEADIQRLLHGVMEQLGIARPRVEYPAHQAMNLIGPQNIEGKHLSLWIINEIIILKTILTFYPDFPQMYYLQICWTTVSRILSQHGNIFIAFIVSPILYIRELHKTLSLIWWFPDSSLDKSVHYSKKAKPTILMAGNYKI